MTSSNIVRKQNRVIGTRFFLVILVLLAPSLALAIRLLFAYSTSVSLPSLRTLANLRTQTAQGSEVALSGYLIQDVEVQILGPLPAITSEFDDKGLAFVWLDFERDSFVAGLPRRVGSLGWGVARGTLKVADKPQYGHMSGWFAQIENCRILWGPNQRWIALSSVAAAILFAVCSMMWARRDWGQGASRH
jgi:hypothetical protein